MRPSPARLWSLQVYACARGESCTRRFPVRTALVYAPPPAVAAAAASRLVFSPASPSESSCLRVPAMSQVPAERSVPGADEVGGGRRAADEAQRGGPMAAVREGAAVVAAVAAAAAARGSRMAAAAAREGRMAEARGGAAGAARAGAGGGGGRDGAVAAAAAAAAAAASREARMAEVARLLGEPLEEEGPEGRPRSRAGHAGGLAALPYLRLRHPLSVLGINYQQFLRHYLENYPIAPGRIQELEERRRRFVEACRAREAAFDAEYQRNPHRVDFDVLTFTIALTASEVINPLIEELGCDRFINRE
uniref:EP300-interacting inhibitor of differentiation 2 n=1 Tax=Jaculus jaculus TaxID=51337 RepID=UPI001E1B3A2E|nr:EP300-interacting inhibitor of differentiation 2 [Jaculus jaculus]